MCAPNIKRISFLSESQILFRVLTSTSGKAEFCGNDSPENPFCCLRHEALVSVENLMKTEPNSCSETKHDVNWRKHRLQVDSNKLYEYRLQADSWRLSFRKVIFIFIRSRELKVENWNWEIFMSFDGVRSSLGVRTDEKNPKMKLKDLQVLLQILLLGKWFSTYFEPYGFWKFMRIHRDKAL